MMKSMLKRYSWLLLLVVLLLLYLWLDGRNQPGAADQAQEKVLISLTDPDQRGVAGVDIRLLLYRFDDQGSAESIPAGKCTTGQDGRCEIPISSDAPRDRSGFLRGALDLGALGRRSLLWPGGSIQVALRLNREGQLQVDSEAKPDEYATPGGVEVRAARPPLYLGGILLGLLFLALTVFLFRRARKQ